MEQGSTEWIPELEVERKRDSHSPSADQVSRSTSRYMERPLPVIGAEGLVLQRAVREFCGFKQIRVAPRSFVPSTRGLFCVQFVQVF
ncbi:hypothetical protein [Paenibacillus lutrae]|uniref:Uncharacterized protein n=1 Tax=Paenibacillus lutrae TaxID=2078573 RepID=A0A7X3K156_9BACL|nr:hypothetical protein [Paenibacillus lutrae]MVP01765.1 hypothetical protein [Paenibacillus lutrae]